MKILAAIGVVFLLVQMDWPIAAQEGAQMPRYSYDVLPDGTAIGRHPIQAPPTVRILPSGIGIVQVVANHDTFWISCDNGLILVAQLTAAAEGITWSTNWVGGSADYMRADIGSWVLIVRGSEIWAHDRSSLRRVHPL